MSLYQNGHHRLLPPRRRGWIFPRPDGQPDHWTIFELGFFFQFFRTSGRKSEAWPPNVVKAVLQTQYPNGNIPNWRGRFNGTPDRSQPPVGSFAVLKLFLRTGDRELIKFAYPYLWKWHQFWTEMMPGGHPRRDGNSDGLLEWGSDASVVAGEVPPWEKEVSSKQRAMWESGQDDLPNWDEAIFNEKTGTLEMNCVDLNSLYALDSYCLARLAEFLGKEEDRKRFLEEYERIKKLMNLYLWNEKKDSILTDTGMDGFLPRKQPPTFSRW